MKKLVKGLLSLNLAGAVRLLRFGPGDAAQRLARAYHQIDPFGGRYAGAGTSSDECRAELALIPQAGLSEVVRNRPTIKVDSTYSYHDGSLPWCDIMALLAILVDRAPASVLEIGTFNGYTTRLLALNMPSSTIHTIDLPAGYDPGSDATSPVKDDLHLIASRNVGIKYRSDPSISNVVQHFGDTATWDFRDARDATLYYIDGAHTYEYARNDTEKALAASQDRDATILWHDCDQDHPGVVRWLKEMSRDGYPVRRIAGTNLAIMDSPARASMERKP
jgi:Methyltransferase domain